MVAAAASRVRTSAAPVSGASAARKSRRSAGTYVLIGLPVLLAVTFVWQIASSMLRTEGAIRDAVAISSVSLEADPSGSRIDLVVVDRLGQATTVNGDIDVRLREPDGTVWQTTRHLAAADFRALPSSGLLNGRLGYSVTIPATAWIRAPRRGGAATVTITIQPTDGTAISTVAEERFP